LVKIGSATFTDFVDLFRTRLRFVIRICLWIVVSINYIFFRRDSLHLSLIQEKSGGEEDVRDQPEAKKSKERKYNISFTFDSDVRCAITIFYFCTEEITANGVTFTSARKDLTSKSYEYRRGAAQIFSHNEHVFLPSCCEAEIQTWTSAGTDDSTNSCPPSSEQIAIAVHCVSLEGDLPRQSHTTIGAFSKYSDGSYSVKAHKQKLFVDGLSYLLQEIYGLENKTVEAAANKPYTDVDDDGDDCGAECVVCMVDLRDTIILPCRHLCLCYACADSLRYQANNCPICRAPFRALLQIRAVQKIGQVTHPALPVDPEPSSEMPVPPGYQCVSLIEALNGSSSSSASGAGNSGPTAVPVQTVVMPSSSSAEKKSRKRSSKPRQPATSSLSGDGGGANVVTAASTCGPMEAGAMPEEVEAMIDDNGCGGSGGGGEQKELEEAKSRSSSSSSLRNISLKYVNETGDVSGSNGGGSIRMAEEVAAVEEIAARVAASKSEKGDTLVSSMDLIDEELANMSVAAAVPQSLLSTSPCPRNWRGIRTGSLAAAAPSNYPSKDDEDDTVAVTLASSGALATHASMPGTPTSIVSARSSQDSSTSSSSTKQLLPPTATVTAASVQVPKSAGSAVIVRVHPRTTAEGDEEEEDENRENEEDC
jgi:hypothetical protein